MSDELDAQAPQASLRSLLEHMLRIEASELYLSAGSPPVFRVQGVPYPGRVALEAAEIGVMADALMTEDQREQFRVALELDLVLPAGPGSDARFCVNVFWQRRAPGMVVRALPGRLRTLGELGLPSSLAELAFERGGLVLIAGERRSGKSSTLAALVDHRNATAPGSVMTIEDPIELLHAPKQCVVSQREIGVDTRSYLDALRQVPRQAPDLLMVDSLRSAEVLESVLTLVSGGLLCLSSVHARGAVAAIGRVLDLVPPARHAELLSRLASNLCAVVAQRLVPTVSGGRMAVLEILRGSELARNLLRRGELATLSQALAPGADGACSFDDALAAQVEAGRVALAHALAAADDPRELERRLSGLAHRDASQRSAGEAVQLRFAPELPDGSRAGKPLAR